MEFKIVVQMLIPTYTKLHIAKCLCSATLQQLTKFFVKLGAGGLLLYHVTVLCNLNMVQSEPQIRP